MKFEINLKCLYFFFCFSICFFDLFNNNTHVGFDFTPSVRSWTDLSTAKSKTTQKLRRTKKKNIYFEKKTCKIRSREEGNRDDAVLRIQMRMAERSTFFGGFCICLFNIVWCGVCLLDIGGNDRFCMWDDSNYYSSVVVVLGKFAL